MRKAQANQKIISFYYKNRHWSASMHRLQDRGRTVYDIDYHPFQDLRMLGHVSIVKSSLRSSTLGWKQHRRSIGENALDPEFIQKIGVYLQEWEDAENN